MHAMTGQCVILAGTDITDIVESVTYDTPTIEVDLSPISRLVNDPHRQVTLVLDESLQLGAGMAARRELMSALSALAGNRIEVDVLGDVGEMVLEEVADDRIALGTHGRVVVTRYGRVLLDVTA